MKQKGGARDGSPCQEGEHRDLGPHGVRRPSGMPTSLEVAHVGEPLEPTATEVDLATAAYEWISPESLYARIDLLDSSEYGLMVLELELVGPAPYLRDSTAIAHRFAMAVQRLLPVPAV